MNQQEAVQLYLTAYKKAADTSPNAGEGHVFFDAQDLIGRSRQALAEQDRLRREQLNRSFPDITRQVSETVKQQEPVSDVRVNAPVSTEVPYGRVIDAIDTAQRKADSVRAPSPTRDEIARARMNTPRGRADKAVAQFLQRQSDADLGKMWDRAPEEEAATAAYRRKRQERQRAAAIQKQSDAELGKMVDRAPEEAIQTGIFEAATAAYQRKQWAAAIQKQSDADLGKMVDRAPEEEAATAAYQRKQQDAKVQRQSDAELGRLWDRAPEEEAATAAYQRKQRAAAIQKQSDADLGKMVDRAPEEAIQTGIFEAGQQPKNRRILGMRPRTAALVGGGAGIALGGGIALLLALRKRAKKKREQAGSEKKPTTK